MSRSPTHEAESSGSATPSAAPRRIVLRFRALPSGAPPLPYEDGVEDFLTAHHLLPEWANLQADFPGATLKRVYFTLTPAEVANLQVRASRMAPGLVEDLLRLFYVDTPDRSDPHALLSRIQSIGIVDRAYLESPPTPPPSPAPPGTLVHAQAYLDPSPDGIGVRALWGTVPNSRGEGMQFADVEPGWYIYVPPGQDGIVNHCDLLPAAAPPVPVTMPAAWGGQCAHLSYQPHGTSVVGILRANEDAPGCAGIASQADGYCVCEVRPNGVFSRPDAILTAAAHLQPGDVLLLEMQVLGAQGPGQHWPVEIELANLQAIAVATAIGITVIEATGNGEDRILDSNGAVMAQDIGELDRWFLALRRGTLGAIDSGAVMVAGAKSTVPHGRRSDTRYGSRVDCYAWGENVATTHNGPVFGCSAVAAPVNDYTDVFGGSSAASAIVAGAALVVQSMHRREYGFPASATRVRDLLSDPATGTPSALATDRIGVMPDLQRIAARVNPRNKPEIYLRDFVGDTGAPHAGPSSNSPDIIVRRVPVPNPTAAFGPGSGYENDDMLSDTVLSGQDQSLYVRLKNLAAVGSGPVAVNVYWAEVGTLILPSMWHHIGADHTQPSIVVANVPAGGALTVSDAITWLASEIPASGHYCFVALVSCPGDPAPHPYYLGDWGAFVNFIQHNNNVTWRNFNVIDPVTSMSAQSIPFVVPGAEDRAVRMALEATSDLPPDVRLAIDVPEELERVLAERVTGSPRPGHGMHLDFSGAQHGTLRLGVGEFPAGRRWRCALRLPETPRKPPLRGGLSIRQLFVEERGREVEVGRVTWRFTGQDP